MALETHNLLLPDFLATLSRNISVSRIDFSQTPLPEYSGFYAVILDDVMSEEECELLIKAAESSTSKGWERAKVDIGGGSQALDFEYHNCSLIMWNSAETVAKIWKRIENIPEVQEIVRLQSVPKITGNFATRSGEVWRFTRPHEYMRFLKYQRGEYEGKSFIALHLYLNGDNQLSGHELAALDAKQSAEASRNILLGGATTFHSHTVDTTKQVNSQPKAGRILLFQHRDLLHSGDEVVQGVKYTVTTDLMYSLETVEHSC